MIKFQLTDLENLLSDELRQGGLLFEQNQGFAADNLATIIPAGHDLEVQSSLSWLRLITDDDWFQGQVLYTVIVLGGRSP